MKKFSPHIFLILILIISIFGVAKTATAASITYSGGDILIFNSGIVVPVNWTVPECVNTDCDIGLYVGSTRIWGFDSTMFTFPNGSYSFNFNDSPGRDLSAQILPHLSDEFSFAVFKMQYPNSTFIARSGGFKIEEPFVDLIASAPTPNTAQVGVEKTFSTNIKNQGNMDIIYMFNANHILKDGPNGTGNTVPVNGNLSINKLSANETKTISLKHTFTSPGNYSMQACADPWGDITESNENNNCSTWTNITVLPAAPVVTVTASPTIGAAGIINPTVSWSATNNPTSCTPEGDWKSPPALATNTIQTQSQEILTEIKTYTYSLTCSNGGGSSSKASATITVRSPVIPVVSISASPTLGVAGIVNPTITWSATNNPTSCIASGDWKTKPASASSTPQTQAQGILSAARIYKYTLICSNSDGQSAETSATVDVRSPAVPVVTISANPANGVVKIVNPTIKWSATNNPTSCSHEGDWISAPALATSTEQTQSQGVLNTAKTYSYSLTCSNADGSSAKASATVSVSADPNYFFLAPIPGSGASIDPTQQNAISDYINIIIRIWIGICAVLAVIMIVVGGLEYMTSELISSKEAGKKKILGAVFGLALVLGAWTILNTINPNLLNSDLGSLNTGNSK